MSIEKIREEFEAWQKGNCGMSLDRDERDQLKAENEALRKDAERYRWLRDEAGSADWEHIGYQSAESRDKHIDDYRGHAPSEGGSSDEG